MFAVVRTGGKQYRVVPGDVIRVERLAGDAGGRIELADVLMLGGNGATIVGAPAVANAAVRATVLEQIKDTKVIIFKKKRRANYRRRKGHRQLLTVLRVTDIVADGKVQASYAVAAPAPKKAKPAKPAAETSAAPAAATAQAKPARPATRGAKAPAKKAPAKKAAAKKSAPAKSSAKSKGKK